MHPLIPEFLKEKKWGKGRKATKLFNDGRCFGTKILARIPLFFPLFRIKGKIETAHVLGLAVSHSVLESHDCKYGKIRLKWWLGKLMCDERVRRGKEFDNSSFAGEFDTSRKVRRGENCSRMKIGLWWLCLSYLSDRWENGRNEERVPYLMLWMVTTSRRN